jgi:hypothetical protein
LHVYSFKDRLDAWGRLEETAVEAIDELLSAQRDQMTLPGTESFLTEAPGPSPTQSKAPGGHGAWAGKMSVRRVPRTEHLKPWRPGQSGNPRGGASPLLSMATMIRHASGAGAELVAFYFGVLRGESFPLAGSTRRQRPTLDQRLEAAAWLADRGWGRAREVIQLAGESTAEERLALLKRLSEPERETLRAILTRALEEPATASPGPEEGRDAGATALPRGADCTGPQQ